MSKIFINYRRVDSQYVAGFIFKALEKEFGRGRIFMDIDSIYPGTNFPSFIEEQMKQCQTMIVIIGASWLNLKFDNSQQRRLEAKDDWVRREIEFALQRKISLLPVLLEGAAMPKVFDLPHSLTALSNLQATSIRPGPYFNQGVQRLIDAIEKIVPITSYEQHFYTDSIESEILDEDGDTVETLKHDVIVYSEIFGEAADLEMVKLPSGRFMMGAPKNEEGSSKDERPRHKVRIREFWISRTPVTQAQYKAVIGKNPSAYSRKGNRPVTNVSWHDAQSFCKTLSQKTGRIYRLPSEAEWEYACRAGTTSPFCFGPTITSRLANYDGSEVYGNGPEGNYRDKLTNVEKFLPNIFGLYDMHGNVKEWCEDTWHDNYKGAPSDGSPWLTGDISEGKVCRGGSHEDDPEDCRCASRKCYELEHTSYNTGFRVVSQGT